MISWWTQQANENKAKRKEFKPPEKCTFCGRKIGEGDYFNVGYDRYKIYAQICDHIRCKQWLKWKLRLRRPL